MIQCPPCSSPQPPPHLTYKADETSRHFPVIRTLLLRLPGDEFSTDICGHESAHFSLERGKRNVSWTEGLNRLGWKLLWALTSAIRAEPPGTCYQKELYNPPKEPSGQKGESPLIVLSGESDFLLLDEEILVTLCCQEAPSETLCWITATALTSFLMIRSIYWTNRYWGRSHSGAGDKAGNKTEEKSCPYGAYILGVSKKMNIKTYKLNSILNGNKC